MISEKRVIVRPGQPSLVQAFDEWLASFGAPFPEGFKGSEFAWQHWDRSNSVAFAVHCWRFSRRRTLGRAV